MAPFQLQALLLSVAAAVAILRRPPVALASPNVVATVGHRRSTYANYCDGLDVVKRQEGGDEEYVTSFYKRVRDRRRQMFGRQLRQDDEKLSRRNLDHSLDHYFDHYLTSSSSPRGEMRSTQEKAPSLVSPSAPSSHMARSVRGGGAAAAARHLHFVDGASDRRVYRALGESSPPSLTSREDQVESSKCDTLSRLERREQRGRRRGRLGARPRGSHQSHHHTTTSRDHLEIDDNSLRDFYDDLRSHDLDEGDDCPEHHLGLLRVPCSIAINSEEASLGHHAHHHHHHHHGSSPRQGRPSQSKTSVAAYVDTGAQVTIISASAAKRAGIYHLMDRRYAGRATGVGHCKVLGRIPARHVHFILGCDDEHEDAHSDGGRLERGRASDTARMDGPALTVLEGTVTPGVDVLLGLDVLQDWEAEIRMGPEGSITVKRRRGRGGLLDGGGSMVIPFASPRVVAASRYGEGVRSRTSAAAHRRRGSYIDDLSESEDDVDIDDYSPADSDIESDLDLLDRSGREFPESSRGLVSAKTVREMEDEIMGTVRVDSENCSERVEDDEDYLRDVDDDVAFDGEMEVDLSGL